jgi:hypothetical protein
MGRYRAAAGDHVALEGISQRVDEASGYAWVLPVERDGAGSHPIPVPVGALGPWVGRWRLEELQEGMRLLAEVHAAMATLGPAGLADAQPADRERRVVEAIRGLHLGVFLRGGPASDSPGMGTAGGEAPGDAQARAGVG